MVEMVIQGRH